MYKYIFIFTLLNLQYFKVTVLKPYKLSKTVTIVINLIIKTSR